MRELNSSLDNDRRMLREDITASQAHAWEIHRRGIIDEDELVELLAGLDDVGKGIADGSLELDPELEDIHMNVEVLLGRFTDTAARLHTARSRNDQVVTDFRLFCRNQSRDLARSSLDLASTFAERARESTDWVMPEYTHSQRAQVTTLGHHLLTWSFMFLRDCDRLLAACDSASHSALGSGACVGVNYAYDREAVSRYLEMDPPIESSLDAVSDRDFATDLLYACSACAVHLSRLGGEWVQWSTAEFDFLTMPEEFCSGSSIMPQKRNPDAAELLRGNASGAVADLGALLNLVSGLPLGYSKDLQEDKTPVMRTVGTLGLCLNTALGIVAGAGFHKSRMRGATSDPGLYAVDMTDALVTTGLPFRKAHEAVGRLMRHLAEDPEADVRNLKPAALKKIDPALERLDLVSIMDPEESVQRHKSQGGPSSASMEGLLTRTMDRITEIDGKLSSGL